MKFKVGDIVCTNDQGKRTYRNDDRQRDNLVRARVVSVLDAEPQILQVVEDNSGIAVGLYGNCVDLADTVTDGEVNAAIESITKTPRRGQ